VSKREVTDAVEWYALREIRAWLDTHKADRETVASLARKVGMSKMHLGNVLKTERGVGIELTRNFAKLLGLPLEEFETRAEAAYREHRRGLETRIELEERYPNRAAILSALGDELDPVARRAVQSLELHSAGDPPKAWWMRRVLTEIERAQLEREHPELVEAKREADAKHADKVSGEIQAKMAKAREEIARRKKGDG
jgi:transcriptional regulator with XRE-family HTH domain